jgi:RNA polymerase sigma factor (sigma-70 family)
MSPIRDKPVKWEGEENDRRFKNVGGFKYDVVEKGTVYVRSEDFLPGFLGNTAEEAEKIYEEFKGVLNNLAFSYSVSTGLQKSDLFGEAVIGLARARRDFDKNRSENFKGYAIVRIKDALNEYVRENKASVSIPAYLRSANALLQKIKGLLQQRGFYNEDIHILLSNEEIEGNVPEDIENECREIAKNIKNIADRANITIRKLIERAVFIPLDTEIKESENIEIAYDREEEKMHAALIVDKLKKFMTDEELQIAEGIMAGKTYAEIAEGQGKTPPWVLQKLEKMRERLVKKINKEGIKS